MAIAYEAQLSCRFYVEVAGIPQAVFTEVSGLQIETEVMEYAEGGNNSFVHRRPGRTKVGNLVLKSGLSGSKDFFDWCVSVAPGKIQRHNVSVIMYDLAGNPLRRWNFVNAYPVKWSGPQLSADGKTAAIETLELAHEGLTPG